MDSAEKVDKQLLDNALAIHPNSGLAILARPDLPEDTQRVNQPGLQRLLGVLGRMFDYVVHRLGHEHRPDLRRRRSRRRTST